MVDMIRHALRENLHAATLGEAIACDYHERPKVIAPDGPVLFEAIRLVDHPQLQINQWPNGWILDAAHCSDHTVLEIVEPTRGFEEALIRVPVMTSNSVVSVIIRCMEIVLS